MSEPTTIAGPVESRRREQRALALLLGLTIVLRTLTALFGPNHFSDDRDAYLGIAQGMAAGRGFSVPGSRKPTAYRPPLYPLLIAPVSGDGTADQVGRGVLHVALAAVTVWLVSRAGSRLGLSLGGRLFVGGLIAVDPLLVLYANFPMTETLCAMLGAWLVERSVAPPSSWRGAALTGIVFGLCVLSRPTFLASGALLAGFAVVRCFVFCVLCFVFRMSHQTPNTKHPFRSWILIVVGACCMVAPWVVRNWLVMGHPILTTTHGGYTLLLGNNDSFYEEVVSHSWSTEWEGGGQEEWADELNRTMDRLHLADEVERDRWMSQLAERTIADHPGLFLKASLTRAIQFWHVLPGGESERQFPRWLLIAVAIFYVSIWISGLVGVVLIGRGRRASWMPLLLIPLSFWLAHTVFWSNIRMRAPVMPAVVLIAGHGLCRLKNLHTS